ncbi:minor tail protein [Mycobacterium phage PRodriguez]|nr:minor tail protein [Mycobacterium phage PRodriguez]
MTFRGYFALNGVEIANSSRVAAHLGVEAPTSDVGMFEEAGDCSLTPIEPGRLLSAVAPSQTPIGPGRLLYTPPDGTRLYGPGLGVVGDCWSSENMCFGCRLEIGYDDTWPGLKSLVDDGIYRPELAPWYTTRAPESGEFGGIWVMDVKGLGPTPVSRPMTEMAGPGGVPGPHRDTSRAVSFDALLIACTSAGLQYGLQWLACRLRETVDRDDSTLRYLAAHPGHSAVDPQTLIREVHGVVLTKEPQITASFAGGSRTNQQATVYRVTWELGVSQPYAYLPQIDLDVAWDEVVTQPIQWVHGADCEEPADCAAMPILFSDTCTIETIDVITSPPPNCGGCLPVGLLDRHRYSVPVFSAPYRCRETAASVTIRNVGERQLTLQGHWRLAETNPACKGEQFPIQVAGLPPGGELHLNAVSGRYWARYGGRKHRPWGIVGTPSGAPWQPPIIDRSQAWEFIVTAPGDAEFEVEMSLADREA